MIEPLPGWSWEVRESGIFLRPLDDPGACVIRYGERVRPLAPPSAVAASLPWPDGFTVLSRSKPERLVTAEGEYAAVLTIEARSDAATLHRVLGMVFGDDFYSLILGASDRTERFGGLDQTVRRLAETDSHMLGTRRRRYVYGPPEGWLGYAAGVFHAHYFPPDFPRNLCLLAVFPALPVAPGTAQAEALLETHLRNGAFRVTVMPASPTQVCSSWGLSGRSWSARGRFAGSGEGQCDFVVLEDKHYVYPVMLIAPPDAIEGQQRLRDLVASVEPIPDPRGAAITLGAGTLGYWSE